MSDGIDTAAACAEKHDIVSALRTHKKRAAAVLSYHLAPIARASAAAAAHADNVLMLVKTNRSANGRNLPGS